MRIFVAGATGAVGRQLVPLLLDAGHQVTGISRNQAGVEAIRRQGATGLRADAFDRDALRAAVVAAAPDAVIHQLTDLSGADGAATDRLRKDGTRNLVDAAKAAGVGRFVVQSLAWVYEPGEKPADEATPLDFGAEQPRGAMVDGIKAMEDTAASLGTAVSLRFGILYGPGTWYAPGGPVAAALAGDQNARMLAYLKADGSVSSFLHVADAARATVAALDWPSGPVNVVDDEPAPGRDWLPVLSAALGVPAPGPTPGQLDWARGASNDLARSRGWNPLHPTWRDGFAAQGA
ncbi:Nucleoside-diphosphate-sugar epimerase [Asanoa hainanensis]|uniref:Nucleoside-diphosphate-sugar epimerase n=1 Tax=Asanoa hainanensis TaxID=560556 RepID=A0A239GXA9_9ACTN|nr:NAD(P)-dependent oxidoreductase [Asanoa hainanensis]SNS72694.1 Nucleoside-diphosphate-sugar epimerase [Asanoa hainanensis]